MADESGYPADPQAAIAALRDRELRLRALFDHTFQLIGLLSPDGILLEANQTALEFVGYTRAEAIGLPFWETRWWTSGPAGQADRLRAAIAEAGHGHFARFEAEHRGVDGQVLTVDFSLTPVRDERGEVVYLIPEGRDITERKALERLREDYIALVSHDLRSPLSAIRLRADALRRSLAGDGLERELQDAEAIADAGARVAAMLDELVEVTRLESRGIELHCRRLDLRELVARLLDRALEPAELRRIELRGGSAHVLAEVDGPRIERVVMNLVGNALKYATPGTPITVTVAAEGGRASVAVSDAGPGLAAADAARVFDKYHRTRSARQRADGLGLGLYICRLVVEAHGGEIEVDSAPGRGSTFRFTLAGAAGAPAPEVERAAAARRLLVVDDEPMGLAALADLLRDEGYLVETAASGQEALAKAGGFSPEALLVDVEMPDLSGPELLQQLRSGRPDLPAILMTGHSRHDDAVAALEGAPGVGFVGKPIDLGELLQLVARLAGSPG